MPVKTFQDFRNGVDRRKSEQIVDQLGLYECKNAFINSGFAVKKRFGMDKISSALTADSVGLFEYDESLYIAIFIYLISCYILYTIKHPKMFDEEGHFRCFGLNKNDTIFPFWLVTLMIGLLSYYLLIVRKGEYV